MRLVKSENINNILFLDIETAPVWRFFKDVPEAMQKEWIYKFKFRSEAPTKPNLEENANYSDPAYMDRYLDYFSKLWEKEAGLYPEFSRIVCITVGFIYNGVLRIKCIEDDLEPKLLEVFLETFDAFKSANKFVKLCAHYGKEFDYKFIAKRILIHRLNLPNILDTYGSKPWELEGLLDTHEIWRMSGFKGGATLSSLAVAFGVTAPKDDIDGADVSRVYHEGGIERICEYCNKDVITLVQVFKAIRGEELLNVSQIKIV